MSDKAIDLSDLGATPLTHDLSDLGATPIAGADISRMESLGRGASQGATLGFQDELSPIIERAYAKLFGDQATKDLYKTKSYEDLRNSYRGQNEEAQKANPGTYLGGQLLGMTPLNLATGGQGVLGQAAGSAAIAGANTAGEATDNNDLGLKVAKSAGLGGLFGLGGALAGKAIGAGSTAASQYLGNKAEDFSNQFALRSLGTRKKFIDKLLGSGQAEDLAQLVKKENIVTPTSSFEDIADKLKSALKQRGSQIGAIDQTADQFIQDLSKSNPQAAEALQTTKSGLANSLKNDVVNPISETPGRVADSKNLNNYLENELSLKKYNTIEGPNEIPQPNNDPLSISNLRDFKGNIRDKVNYYGNALNKDAGNQSAFSDLSNAVENKIGNALKGVQDAGVPNLLDQYAPLKKDYGLLSQGRNLIEDKLGRLQANRWFSPTDSIAGIGGFVEGQREGNSLPESLAKGAGFVALNKFGRAYGNQIASKGFEHAATTIDKITNALSSNPQILGSNYARVLSQAAAKGPTDLAVSHYVLQQTDPEYRKRIDDLNKEGVSQP